MPDEQNPRPSRRTSESKDEWMSRLNNYVEEEHCIWLGRLATGDSEAVETYLQDVVTASSYDGQEETPQAPQVETMSMEMIAETAKQTAELLMQDVLNGKPEAVASYIDNELMVKRVNTAMESAPDPIDPQNK